jgi:hypothetical protein
MIDSEKAKKEELKTQKELEAIDVKNAYYNSESEKTKKEVGTFYPCAVRFYIKSKIT